MVRQRLARTLRRLADWLDPQRKPRRKRVKREEAPPLLHGWPEEPR